MTDDADDHEDGEDDASERSTAPQSPYTLRDVGVGAAIAFVGILVVFGVPVALTL